MCLGAASIAAIPNKRFQFFLNFEYRTEMHGGKLEIKQLTMDESQWTDSWMGNHFAERKQPQFKYWSFCIQRNADYICLSYLFHGHFQTNLSPSYPFLFWHSYWASSEKTKSWIVNSQKVIGFPDVNVVQHANIMHETFNSNKSLNSSMSNGQEIAV